MATSKPLWGMVGVLGYSPLPFGYITSSPSLSQMITENSIPQIILYANLYHSWYQE